MAGGKEKSEGFLKVLSAGGDSVAGAVSAKVEGRRLRVWSVQASPQSSNRLTAR